MCLGGLGLGRNCRKFLRASLLVCNRIVKWPKIILLLKLLALAAVCLLLEFFVMQVMISVRRLHHGNVQLSGSIAEWLACWTQAQKGLGSNRSRDAVGYQS